MHSQDIRNDPSHLNEMLADQRQAPEMYQPTNYWDMYAGRFLLELEKSGLRDFKSRRDSISPLNSKSAGNT